MTRAAAESKVKPISVPQKGRQPSEQLKADFNLFSETSKQLAESYRMLENKVQILTRELNESERKKNRVHEAKEKIANRMQALLDFLPGGVIVLDEKGFIVEANPAAEDLLGVELEGRVWRNIINECFAPQNDDGFEVSTKSGRRISISTGSLETQGQIILLTDQTETRRLQKNLSRYEKLSAMGKMVSALAHQIRTPLSAAMLYAGHLCNASIDQDKKQVFSEKLYGRLQHMEKQVRDMMLFVKSELPLNDYVSMCDLETGLQHASEVAVTSSYCECDWVNECEDQVIKCNREALISALMNLINNGIQASGTHPKLTIAMRDDKEKKGCVRIAIIDNGAGMSQEQLRSAKELFYTTKSQGTGLGVAVVQSVTKAHGGTFGMDSELGVGTTAYLVIPTVNDQN